MMRVLVSIGLAGTGRHIDLEVPADIPSGELAQHLADVLQDELELGAVSGDFTLFAFPPGRMIPVQMTLADFGVWNGSSLLIQRAATAYFESSQGVRYLFPGKEFWIGRRTVNSAPTVDESPLLDLGNEPHSSTVSRRHLEVVWQTDNWRIRPVRQARNPVAVNGKQLAQGEELSLRDGDEIQLGAVRLCFRLGIDDHRVERIKPGNATS